LRSLRGAALLTGGRGRPAADIAAATSLIQRCGELLLQGGVGLIELNPVLVGAAGAGAVAVDASVRRSASGWPEALGSDPTRVVAGAD
jgi:hypothetical protein